MGTATGTSSSVFRFYANGQTGEGRAMLFMGSPRATSPIPAYSNWSNRPGATSVLPMDTADVNGDGYADLLVGATYYDAGQTDEGRVWGYLVIGLWNTRCLTGWWRAIRPRRTSGDCAGSPMPEMSTATGTTMSSWPPPGTTPRSQMADGPSCSMAPHGAFASAAWSV